MTEAAVPSPRRGELTPISRTATVLLVLAAGYLWYQTLATVATMPQSFESTYARFDTGALPVLTQLLFQASYFMQAYGYFFMWAGLVAVGVLIWRGMVRDHLRMAVVIAAVSLVTAIGVWVGTLAAMWVPLMTLIRSIGEA